MKRLVSLCAGMMMLVPALAAAQVRPTPPPPPPAPAAPVPPSAPQAPTTPAPPMRVSPVYVDREAIEQAVEAAQIARIDADAIREQSRLAMEDARLAMTRANWDMQSNF